MLIAAAVALLAQAGCGPDGRAVLPTDVPGAAATAARRAATPIPTPVRTPTPVRLASPPPRATPTPGPSEEEQVAAVVERVRAALEAPDLDALRPLMLEQVVIAPGGEQGADTVDRELALSWLKERAAAGPRVIASEQVEQFGLLEIQTGPWETKAPVQTGTIVFNLHRFNERGDQDPYHGDWKIDVLIPR